MKPAALVARSLATQDDIETYTTGECHVLALALHRLRGWKMLAAVDYSDPYWVDEEDEDNVIPSVLHVYAVDPHGIAWDVHGGRSVGDIRTEIETWLRPNDCSFEDLYSEAELQTYAGFWNDAGEPIDRPLPGYREEDVAEALGVIERALAPVPAFQRPPEPDSPARRVVAAIRNEVDDRLITMDFDLSADDNVLILVQLWSERERRAGHATKAMRRLGELADEHGVTIMLEVCRLQYDLNNYAAEDIDRLDALNQDAMTDEQLVRWYEKFGFVGDSGNTPDIAPVMRRMPEPVASLTL